MQNPYLSCFRPIQLYTSAHVPQLVPCGKCPACLNKKRTALGLKLHLEEMNAKYCYFITLTYDNDSLPLFSLVQSDLEDYFALIPCSDRIIWDLNEDFDMSLFHKDKVLPSCSSYSKQVKLHESKIHKFLPYGHGKFALLYYRDAQLWIKRVRQYIYRKYGEKVRYYIIGEYGTKSLRPHWHCLLFFESDSLAKDFEDTVSVGTSERPCECAEFLRSLWKYGICDSKRTNGESYFYVSSYVNKSADFPAVIDALSPQKSYHSQYFGEVLSKEELIGHLQNYDFDGFREHSISASDGSLSDYSLWRSYYERFFPVFSGLSSQDFETTFRLFTSYEWLKERFGTDNVSQLSYRVFRAFFKGNVDAQLSIFRTNYCMCLHSDLNVLSSLNSVIRSSKKFLENAKLFGFTPTAYFRLWQKWYSYVDLKTLRNHYIQCEIDPYYSKLYYSAYDDGLVVGRLQPYSLSYLNDKSDTCFVSFQFDELVKARKAIKHREQVEFINRELTLL